MSIVFNTEGKIGRQKQVGIKEQESAVSIWSASKLVSRVLTQMNLSSYFLILETKEKPLRVFTPSECCCLLFLLYNNLLNI